MTPDPSKDGYSFVEHNLDHRSHRGSNNKLFILHPCGLLGLQGAVLCGTLRTQQVVLGVENVKNNKNGLGIIKNRRSLIKMDRKIAANPAVMMGMCQDHYFLPNRGLPKLMKNCPCAKQN